MEKVANTNVKPTAPTAPTAPAQKNEHAADKDAAFKAKKKAAAKAFAERQKERKENLVKFAKEVIANKGFEYSQLKLKNSSMTVQILLFAQLVILTRASLTRYLVTHQKLVTASHSLTT